MSNLTNVNDVSIAAYSELAGSGAIDSKIELVEKVVEQYGPITGADALAIVNSLDTATNATNLWTRLGDAQRKNGSIRKTGKTDISRTSNKLGALYEFVPLGAARIQAKLEYWQEAKERHLREAARVELVLQRDAEMVREFETLAR